MTHCSRVRILHPARFHYFVTVVFFFFINSALKMCAVWITVVWILLCATLDAAFSSYSEDQCSWRGRQVTFNATPVRLMRACLFCSGKGTGASARSRLYSFQSDSGVLERYGTVHEAPPRHVVTCSSGAIKMFAVACSARARGLSAGGLWGFQADRPESGGICS